MGYAMLEAQSVACIFTDTCFVKPSLLPHTVSDMSLTMNQCVLSRQSLELQPVQLRSRHTDTKRQAVSSLSLTLELPDVLLLSTSFAYFNIAVLT